METDYDDIQCAAARGDLNYMENEKDKSAFEIDTKNSFGWSALTQAVFNGHTEMAEWLFDNGADVNIINRLDCDLLGISSVKGNLDMVRFLKRTQDPTTTCEAKNSTRLSPLNVAAANGHAELVALLIQDGWSTNQACPFSGSTPLHLAITGFHTACVKILLANGADPCAFDAAGVCPVDLVTTHPWSVGVQNPEFEGIRQLLLTAVGLTASSDEMSEIIESSIAGDAVKLNQLLNELQENRSSIWAGYKYQKQKEALSTALMNAAKFGHDKIVSSLIKFGVPPDVTTIEGYTPLMIAATNGHVAICRRLLNAGANSLTQCHSTQQTALDMVKSNDNVPADLLRLLAQHTVAGFYNNSFIKMSPNTKCPPLWSPTGLGAKMNKQALSPRPKRVNSPNLLLRPPQADGATSSCPTSPLRLNVNSNCFLYPRTGQRSNSPNMHSNSCTPDQIRNWFNRPSND